MVTKKRTDALRDWAIENRSFSIKTNDGYWDPYGVFLKTPAGVCRYGRRYRGSSGGWLVSVNMSSGRLRSRFNDSDYSGDYTKSLEAAIAWLNQQKETTLTSWRKIHIREQSRKTNLTGEPGITFVCRKRKGLDCYYFVIRCGRSMIQYLRIGRGVLQGDALYQRKLEEAKRIRESFVCIYLEEHQFVNI